MSVRGTCSGILQLYQSILFHSLKKKEESCIRFRTPLWPEGWGGPRGLTHLPPQGMGGQHGYFGLWIDVDFGKGHSKAKPTCTTYGSPQLSAQEDFQFQKMEVWAVGDAPKAESVSMGALLPSLGLIPCTPFTPPPGDGFSQTCFQQPEECLWVHSWAESPVWDPWGVF